MDFWHLLSGMLVLLSVAFVAGVIFERLGLSAVLGYLLAGLVLGPNSLGVAADQMEVVRGLAELFQPAPISLAALPLAIHSPTDALDATSDLFVKARFHNAPFCLLSRREDGILARTKLFAQVPKFLFCVRPVLDRGSVLRIADIVLANQGAKVLVCQLHLFTQNLLLLAPLIHEAHQLKSLALIEVQLFP